MKVLVTGAGGFIGSHVADACIRAGHHVVGLDSKLLVDWTLGTELNVERLSFVDIADPTYQGRSELPDFDVCYHLAAEARIQPSFETPVLCVKSNILGTVRVLEKARKCSGMVVYTGSSTADSAHDLNVYAATKFAGEELCRTWHQCFQVPVVVVRFYNVYGPRQIEDGRYATVIGIFQRQLREGQKLTVTGNGSQRRDFTHVDDIVSGLIACSVYGKRDGSPYNLGSGTNHSILEVARMFTGDGRIELIPARPGEAETTLADISRTQDHTGWRPAKRLEDYVQEVTNV